MAIDYKNLKLRIISWRRRRKLSQEALADAAGVTREYIGLLETDKRRPSLNTVIKIANALDVSADDLLVDSLKRPSVKTASKLDHLLLGCNTTQKQLIIALIKSLKDIFPKVGI